MSNLSIRQDPTRASRRHRAKIAVLYALLWGPTVWYLSSALEVFGGRPLLTNVGTRLPTFVFGGLLLGWFVEGRRSRFMSSTSHHDRDVGGGSS